MNGVFLLHITGMHGETSLEMSTQVLGHCESRQIHSKDD